MNKITILAISAVFVASVLAITAFEAEAKPPSQSVACPAENIQHWVEVSFSASGNIKHATEQTLSGSTVMIMPLTSEDITTDNNANDARRVADRLNALGYFVDDDPNVPPPARPVEISDLAINVQASFQYYSTICAEN